MRGNSCRGTVVFAVVVMVFVCARAAQGGAGCACQVDVTNDGGVDLWDVVAVNDCAHGNCSGCVVSCDVNCDGVVDCTDYGVVVCGFALFTDCCNRPLGACRVFNGDPTLCPDRCALMPEVACGVFGPDEATWQYYGDGTDCSIPTVSEWGMVILSLAILIAGVGIMRHVHAPTVQGASAP